MIDIAGILGGEANCWRYMDGGNWGQLWADPISAAIEYFDSYPDKNEVDIGGGFHSGYTYATRDGYDRTFTRKEIEEHKENEHRLT